MQVFKGTMLTAVGAITGAPGRRHGGVRMRFDSRIGSKLVALSVWTAVSEYLYPTSWSA